MEINNRMNKKHDRKGGYHEINYDSDNYITKVSH